MMVSRDGYLVVTVVDGLCEVSVKVCPMLVNQWQHIMHTFDGTTVRVYVDGKMEIEQEVEANAVRGWRIEMLNRDISRCNESVACRRRPYMYSSTS